MKTILITLLLACMPISLLAADSTNIKFSSFNINIPNSYNHRATNSALEITDAEKKNALLIIILPDAKKELLEYTQGLIDEYKGSEAIYNEEEQSYSFTFTDGEYGECIAITKELKKKYIFITAGGKNKESLLTLLDNLQ